MGTDGSGGQADSAAAYLPDGRSLSSLEDAAADCRGCRLHEDATQTVFGAGSASAEVMFVGEQPGDREDQEGEPFVGPAGRELDRGLEAVGIDRGDVYITNLVKHFKFEAKGRKRLHESPDRGEIAACRPWLDAELDTVEPTVIVCLGASAAKAMLGSSFRVTRQAGELHQGPNGAVLTATVHPSSILRTTTDEDRHEARDHFHRSLAKIADLIDDGIAAALMHETKDALYARAQQADVEGRSSMTKRELATALAARPLPDRGRQEPQPATSNV